MTAAHEGAPPSEIVAERPTPEASKVPDGIVETTCKWAAMLLLAGLLVLIAIEVVSRNLLGTSWDGTDEYGGYALVALTFLSVPVCLARGGLHEMQVVRARLSARGIARLNTALHATSLVFMLVLAWQYGRLELSSWRTGDVSMTATATPLWIPRAVMLVGSLAIAVTLVRLIAAEWRRAREPAGRDGGHVPYGS